TNLWKYYYTGVCPSVSGTTYIISVLVKNQGTASMQIGGNIAYGPVIPPGATQQVSFTEVGNGVSCIQLGFLTLNTSDPMDVLAYAPAISVGGTNLIPVANQDFSGWTAYQGASVTITQGQPAQVVHDADFSPYGGERAYVNVYPQNYKFEGKERDAETGNDDFGARYYSNRFGRWLSADWSNVPISIPYANLTNPQTLNLYAMVADDPESFADLDGHYLMGSYNYQVSTDMCINDADCEMAAQAGVGSALSQQQAQSQQQNQSGQEQTHYAYYDVQGATASEAMDNANKSAHGGCTSPSAGCTSVDFSIKPETTETVHQTSSGFSVTGTITSANVTASITTTLPKWTGRAGASASEQKAWDSSMAGLMKHEDGHAAIDRASVREIKSAVQGTTANASGPSFKQAHSR